MVTRTARLAAGMAGWCLLVVGLSAPPAGAEDAYAKITGAIQGVIQGDQVGLTGLTGSANTVQVFSTGFNLANPVGATPGQVTGKPIAGPLSFVKRFDRASPKLLRAAFTSEPLTVEIIWWMATTNGARQTTTIRLDNALVTNIDAAASLSGGNASGNEEVTLTYQRITLTVPTINGAGQVTGTTTVCLDVAQGKAC